MTSPLAKTVLVISLSLNVFMLASFLMYGTWLAAGSLGKLTRALLALFVYVFSFGAGAVVFWKIIERISGVENP